MIASDPPNPGTLQLQQVDFSLHDLTHLLAYAQTILQLQIPATHAIHVQFKNGNLEVLLYMVLFNSGYTNHYLCGMPAADSGYSLSNAPRSRPLYCPTRLGSNSARKLGELYCF